MIRSGLRRLFVVFVVIFALTSVVSLLLGALAHANLERALADGFYIAGVAVLIGSFVIGMRGPTRRAEWGEGQEAEAEPEPPVAFQRGVVVPRLRRRTTPEERSEARHNSLALFLLGIALILIGTGFDPMRHPF